MIVVLGAGPAGLTAALAAARRGHDVTVLEKAPVVGGMAGSFEIAGLRVDYGSHRLHPAAAPEVREELERLLGADLQVRPRNGRLRLGGRWVGFPLRPADLARNLPPGLAARAAADAAAKPWRMRRLDGEPSSAAAALRAGLGPALAGAFHLPYFAKLWGTDAEELDAELVRRRVRASSPLRLVAKVGAGARASGRTFLYPRSGFGAISERLADAAVGAGAAIETGAEVSELAFDAAGTGVRLTVAGGRSLEAATVFSTLPAAALPGLATRPPTSEAAPPAARLRHRALTLVYLAYHRYDPVTAFDAHYFPSLDNPVARLSEPRNYRDNPEDPDGVTVLCAEVPCWADRRDELWGASPERLGEVVLDAVGHDGLRLPDPAHVEVRRLPRVYPVYEAGTAWELSRLELWVGAASGGRLVTLGRQGLFVGDNTHHVMAMGLAAGAALRADGTLDRDGWAAARAAFRGFVVED